MRLTLRILIVVAVVVAAVTSISAETRPRLVVVLAIDQCRADYLTRFVDHYLPPHGKDGVGGFRFLLERGAHYRDAHFAQLPTTTGPGHATLLTGASPSVHGIIGNKILDRATGKAKRCTEDDSVKVVGGAGKADSARWLRVSTIGDELKLATGGAAKVVGISFKARAAILMAGHAADVVTWFDEDAGAWISSTYYARTGELPSWLQEVNRDGVAERHRAERWEPLLPGEAYPSTKASPGAASKGALPFSHQLPGAAASRRDFHEAFVASGMANDVVFDVALRAVVNERLGATGPDLLAVNLSTNDYIGHTYGPDSPEVMDISVRTDRALASFLNRLAGAVPGGLDSVLIVVTGDHGVTAIPEDVSETVRARAGRVKDQEVRAAVENALDARFGAADWVVAWQDTAPNLYLNRVAIEERKLAGAEVEDAAARAAETVEGVFVALTRTQILRGSLPTGRWAAAAANGLHPKIGGDLLIVTEPGWILGGERGTTHGSVWSPDTHVPVLLHGPGVHAGVFYRRVTTMDIAPTLAQLLGIGYPNGSQGEVLREALDRVGPTGRRSLR